MPSVDLKLIVSANTKQAENYLKGAASRVGYRNTRSLLNKIGLIIVRSIRDNFKAQASPEGISWAKLKAQPVMYRGNRVIRRGAKRRRTSKWQILVDTGRLKNSIVAEADAVTLKVGTNLKYAAIHQFGGTKGMAPGPAAIPARPFIGVKNSDIPKIVRAADGWLRRQLGYGNWET